MTYTATTIPLANSVDGDVPGNSGDESDLTNVTSSFIDKPIYYDADPDAYNWVGSAFLYENDGAVVDTGVEYDQAPTGTNGGYYMQITYVFNRGTATDDMLNEDNTLKNLSGNETDVRYVPLPKIVRNHDYRVNATVSVNVNGYLIVNYKVTEWETASVDVPSFN